jgi:hypothetical protein
MTNKEKSTSLKGAPLLVQKKTKVNQKINPLRGQPTYQKSIHGGLTCE